MKELSAIIYIFVLNVKAQVYVGDTCVYHDSNSASCEPISNCPAAQSDLKRGVKPYICSFNSTVPIVCCRTPGRDSSLQVPSNAISNPPPEISSEKKQSNDECPPIPASATSLTNTGRKSVDKCIGYLDLVYPCLDDILITELGARKQRYGRCEPLAMPLIVGGAGVREKELPHIVMLGYGPNESTIKWLCLGALISDHFVLTSAHCTYSREYGNVTFALMGVYDKITIAQDKLYRVAEIVIHPQFRRITLYHDIALIRLHKRVTLDDGIRPACLPISNEIKGNSYIASGWDQLNIGDPVEDGFIMKYYLHPISNEECARTFSPNRKLKNGINGEQQMCFGEMNKMPVFLQSDLDGPLQVFKEGVFCMYDLIGVPSFDNRYTLSKQMKIYTRVQYYVPWIEKTIWP